MSILLDINSAKKTFKTRDGFVTAVNDVTLTLGSGEILGLVGESGCGKTTLARCVMGLYSADSGSISLDGQDVSSLSPSELRRFTASVASAVFQNPYETLNPRMTVLQSVAEGLRVKGLRGQELTEKAREALDIVGMGALYESYPSTLSGGQRQRVGIARAVATSPKLLVADEPVSALDMSVRAQIINLLSDLRERLDLAILFIAHDLSLVLHFCDRVAVMYKGRVVELAASEKLSANPLHPYTKLLMSANLTHEKQGLPTLTTNMALSLPVKDGAGLLETEPNHFVYYGDIL